MSVMHDQQDIHSKWMSLASRALESLHSNTSTTQQAIALLGESQMLLLKNFSTSVNASNDSVEQLAARIAELSSAVEGNVSQISGWEGGFSLGTMFHWLPIVGIAWAISRFSERFAALFVLAFGKLRSEYSVNLVLSCT